ncbi:hypothetical protein [Nostoc sp.]|uniref:hypothetical protein n=1 Tax=Nostoc sp. TaxID=1180 RepID=UPI002FFB4C14
MILKNKVALVTGGTAGIGRATAMSSTSRFSTRGFSTRGYANANASTPSVLLAQKWCSQADGMLKVKKPPN